MFALPFWYIVVAPVLAAITAISNILVLAVWIGKSSRNHVIIFLTALAVSDILCASLQGIILPIIYTENIPRLDFCILRDFVAGILSILFHTCSILITCLVAFQRFLACAFPFKTRFAWSNRTSYLCLCGMFLFALALLLPSSLLHDISTISSNASSQFVCISTSMFGKDFNEDYWTVFFPHFRLFVLQICSSIIVVCSMSFCLYTVTRKHVSTSNGRLERARKRTTVMTCLVMILFVIGESPTTISLAFDLFLKSSKNGFVQWLVSIEGIVFGNIVIFISYLLNIWVYIVISKQFRQRLYRILICNVF